MNIRAFLNTKFLSCDTFKLVVAPTTKKSTGYKEVLKYDCRGATSSPPSIMASIAPTAALDPVMVV
jgi:hypothetical protein